MTPITVDTEINAPLQKVWDYYTLPEHITQWNFANPSWCCPSASNDLQVGGKYIARMEAKDGSFGFDFEAIYDEVILGERFSYHLSDGRKAATTFEQMDDVTNVKVVFDVETENDADMQKAGWQAILDNFKSYVEQL